MIFGLVRKKVDSARPKNFAKLLFPLFIGLLVSIVGQSTVAPPANASIFGTTYNVAPKLSGGDKYGEGNCPAGQVVVGMTMGWNPIGYGFTCKALNSDLSISAITGKNTNYVYCPDGKVAVGMAFINSNGIRAALLCNTPPGMGDTEVETQYVSLNNSPRAIDKPVGQAYFGGAAMRCNPGDVMVGWRVWSGAWLDGLAPRCAPFTKFTVTYNVNSGGGSAPAKQQQSGPNASITLSSSYSGTRTGFQLSGWNTQANGLGTDYAAGATITPSANLVLYAKWLSTITYNGNTNSGGTVPDPTVAASSAAITKLANNTGNLVKTGFTFAGWNTTANGAGTSYSGYGYATPLLRYVATDYDTSTKVWTNSGSAGSSFDITSTNMGSGTGITKISTTAGVGGSSNSFTTLKGGTTSRITFPNSALSNYTLCHVARYAGGSKQRIFTHPTVNWLSGYLSGVSGAYNGVGNNGNVGALTGDTNWHLICDYNLNFRNNGTARAAAGRTSLPANIGVATWSNQTSDWEIAEVLFYDVTLGLTQIQQIEESLSSTYGLSSYTTTNGTYASTGNTTLYAQWNSTITYNGNGQTSASSTVPVATIAKGTSANTTLANAGTMAKNGYTFAGWNTQADGLGTNYASGLSTYQSAGNVTLYAKWTRTITYNSNGANSGSPERASDTFVNSTTPSISTFPTVGTMVRTGYTFAGWSTTTSGTALSTPYSTTAEVPLYARWTANTYTIVYDTSTATSGTMADTSFTAGTAFSLRANAFSRTGHTFKNWNTAANGSGTTYTNSQAVTLYGGLTLYPQWNLAAPGVPTVSVSAGNTEVTVTPTAAAASGTTVGATTSMLVTAYTNAGAALNPAKTCTVVSPATSCVITGLTNGTAYKFAATATNVTSTSARSAQVSGTPVGVIVTYSASVNGGIIGTSGTTGSTTATFNKGLALTLPTASKADAVFSGWYTTQSSGGQLVGASGASYSPTAAITLYARFAGIVYTISYNGNGNTGGTVPTNGSYQAGSSSGYNNTQSYDYTGADQTFTVPNDITGTQEIQVEVWGAGGGGTVAYYGPDYGGGAGGYTKATISTATAGETLTIKVGKGGTVKTTTSAYGGAGIGGNTSGLEGSSGGGFSGVFTSTTPLAISGGGGGASPGHSDQGIAGGGGGANQSGAASSSTSMGGRGGTTSAGGAKAASCATDGAQYSGGNGCGGGSEGGGGGGAGYYGGGGGNSNGTANGGGGGGSGYLDATRGSLVTATAGQNGALASTWAFPNKTSANYGSNNAGRGGKANTNTTADNSGGNGRVVIQWKTGTGAYTILGSPTKVGYTFAGWNTKSDGTGTDYAVNASYSTNANLALFAKWTAASRTVTYALDGGTSSANTSQLTGRVVGNTVTLPASNTMSKNGYSFSGWSDGTSTYSGGATWTVPASDSNFTLTALWNTQTFTYSYDTNGGGTAPVGGTKTYGESLVLASSTGLSKAGFTFAGWNDGSTTSNADASVSITTNKIFVAQWTAQSYTISYSGNTPTSGSVTSGSFVAGGVPYAIAANGFTKDGYTFAGWKDTSNNSYIVGAGYSTAANLALIAQWTPSSYIVTYNGNGSTGGSAPSSGTLTTGTTFNASSNSGSLVKAGYDFAGWNTSADGTGTNIAVGGVVTTTSNVTLYAKWSIISPSIIFNKGIAESITLPGSTSANFGSLFTLPTTDTATVISSVNYAFTGWSDGTNIYQANSTYRMGTANITFTAQWVAVFTVRYVLNGGTGTAPADVLRANNFQETLTSATITKTGFTLSGWKDQSGADIASGANNWVISNSSYIAYAQWTATQRTLSFGLDSGSGSAPVDITGKVIGEIVALPTTSSTKTGYTFGGWSSGGVTYPAAGTFIVGDGNAAFVAVWISNTNIITYNANGATSGTAPADGSFVTGALTQYTVSTNTGNLAKSGFTFDGWYTTATGTGGTGYSVTPTAGTLITNTNLTLYAKWSAATYTTTYNTDGGSTAPSQTTNAYGSTVTLPSAPTKQGNNFLGWETGSGASANLFAPGASYVMEPNAVTFIARWSGVSYAITYALNGGTGTAPTQANISSGGSFTTAATPSKTGFTFTGWSDGATTTNASTLISNVSDNMTLTAQWTIAIPGVPGAPIATPGNGSATISIAAPTSGGTPSSYTVTASPGGATCTVTAPGTSCTIAPLTNGTAYTFTSTATNAAGSSTSGSIASSAVTPAGVPSAPSGVSGTGTGGTINIAWTTPSSDGGSAISDYIVEYSVDGSGIWTTFADGTSTATSATVTGLIAGNAYEFRVAAKNIIGNSLPSFSSPTIETLPFAPTITGVTSASEQVTVNWSAPSHLGSGTIIGDQYVVTAYDASGNEAGSCKPISGQTTCVVTGLDNGSSYTFKVAVITTVGTSEQSVASATAIPAGVPSAPANVTAVTSGSNMTITFDAPADNGGSAITSYLITSSPPGATCSVGANATTYTCTGLTAGTNYTYSVKAVNSKGQSSASLDSTAVTAVAAPSAPQNVSAVIEAGTTTLSATVSFDAPTTDNGSVVISYRVTASPGGATCTVNAPTTYCEIPVLPDRVYTFTVTATNAVGTSVSSSASLATKAANGIAPTLVVDPIPAPTGDLAESKVLSSNITFADFNSTPNSVVTYQWMRCTDPLDDTMCTSISGAINATYTLTSGDVDKYIRVAITATNSIDTITKLSNATEMIIAAPTNQNTITNPSSPTCDAACQAVRDAAAAKALADAAAKIAADKLAADAAAKLKADAAAIAASNKAAADAAAAAAAAKAAVEKAGAAAAAKAAADAAALTAAAQAKAASDAQAAANKAAAAAAAALKNSTTTAAAKAAATASANKAAAAAAAAVKAAAAAATNAAKAESTAANASKQVDIAINSLNSKTAASQSSAQANAIAAAAKAAANEAAAAAAEKARQAKATAAAAQKVAAETAARIASEQREAALAAVAAKAAADAAAKATAEKIAATNAAKVATENLVKVLDEKAALADQAAKATTEEARAEINRKIEEIANKVIDAQKITEEATNKADDAIEAQEEATDAAEEAFEVAETQAAEAVAVKTESSIKNAAATRAVTAATVAAKVATAAKAAAAKVPSKAVIATRPSTSKNKNSATATVTGLKPGQKVKVTVNVKGK